MHLFSQSCSIVLLCVGELLTATFSFFNSMCVRLPGIALIRVSCHYDNNVVLLNCVCCTRLIRTSIIVCSVSFHLHLPAFTRAAAAAHPLEFEVSWYRSSQFTRCFLPKFVCGMTFPTLCLLPEHWMCFREQSTVSAFLSCVFLFLRGAGACGAAKAIYKKNRFSNLGKCHWFY